MKVQQTSIYYWGIGLENETYMQFDEPSIVAGDFIQENIGCERYSIDYRNCYKPDALVPILSSGFNANEKYKVSRMINSHSLEKLDINYEHKTLVKTHSSELNDPNPENPDYAGKSILELFLDGQPHNIWSMFTQKTNPMGSVNFDGDSIEFVTKYFENRTIKQSCDELKTTKKLFIDKINESEILPEKLSFPDYNTGLNMFMSNQQKIVLFNNGTYHFHLTLPTLTENSRIVDYTKFSDTHSNAIYLLQWFEPLFLATLGSPDIMAVISTKHNLDTKFAMGSMRNAMSRYTGVGTFNKSMPKGKVLTYNVEEFRKLLSFEKEGAIWWRDQIEAEMEYQLLSDLGLDFNQEKMYQSGFEIRCFDEFPASYLPDVIYAIVLICEHSLNLPDVKWGHDSIVWNNLVFKALKHGYSCEISDEEKKEILDLLRIINPSDSNFIQLKGEFEAIHVLDAFFFKVLEVLHDKYKESNVCIDSLTGQKMTSPPKWDNFNKYQIEQHLKQITAVE